MGQGRLSVSLIFICSLFLTNAVTTHGAKRGRRARGHDTSTRGPPQQLRIPVQYGSVHDQPQDQTQNDLPLQTQLLDEPSEQSEHVEVETVQSLPELQPSEGDVDIASDLDTVTHNASQNVCIYMHHL